MLIPLHLAIFEALHPPEQQQHDLNILDSMKSRASTAERSLLVP